jgi:flagellar hook-associated protein 2
MASIASTLGIGSGIDTKALVAQLVAAQRDPRVTTLTAKAKAITTQISGLAQIKSGLANFSTSLGTLVAGGTLSTQPSSSDATTVKASLISGAKLGALASTIQVQQLATQQIVNAPGVATADTPVGTGTLTFTFGTATGTAGATALDGFTPGAGTPVAITIDQSNDSLTGLAAAINAKNIGVSASIVNDGAQARLVLKGPTGAAQAFTITGDAAAATSGLDAFAFGTTAGGSTLQQLSKDSIAVVDGISVTRATNTLTDVIGGVKLELLKESATSIAIGSTRPTESLSGAITDFVAAYNELQTILDEQTDPLTGTLGSDATVRQMRRMLTGITSTQLRAAESPRTLAEIGVSTNRDGTLTVDAARLAATLAANPDAIESMFNPSQTSSSTLLKVASVVGSAKAGSYAVTDVVAAKPGTLSGEVRDTLFATPPLTVPSGGWALKIGVDGKTAQSITLPAGDYASGDALAMAISDAIKANAGVGGIVRAEWSGDRLVLSSALVGRTSAIAFTADDATVSATLGLDAATIEGGRDAWGKIGGRQATAIGSRLYGAVGSEAEGLSLQVSGDVASATINVDLGLNAALGAISTALTATGGGIYTANARLEKQQADIAKQQERVAADATTLETRLTRQFASMDTRVAAYKATQTFLTQQIDAWNASSD